MRSVCLAVAAMFVAALMFLSPVQAADYAPQKVVYQIDFDDPALQNRALHFINNEVNAVGKDKIDVRVVMFGPGVSMLLKPDAAAHTKLKHGNATEKMTAFIAGLKNEGVKFEVCNNTLKNFKVNYENDLYDVWKDDVVPSGVTEVVKLQQQGYAYIRP